MSPYLRPVEGDPSEPNPGAPLTITVDGHPIDALPGQTVAAALMATGQTSWRTTRAGTRPRGVFCGIGACYDCLITVNGLPDIRACQRVLQPGDAITPQLGATLPSTRPVPGGVTQPDATLPASTFQDPLPSAAPAPPGAPLSEPEASAAQHPAASAADAPDPAASAAATPEAAGSAGAAPDPAASAAATSNSVAPADAAPDPAASAATGPDPATSAGAAPQHVGAAAAASPFGGGRGGDFGLGVSVLGVAGRSGGAQGALGDGVRVVAVVVVGAGPAGMSAAVAAADAGCSVLLVDAAASVGGQFNRQLPAEFRARRPEKLHHGWSTFARLRDRIAADPRITHLTETTVWALERPADPQQTQVADPRPTQVGDFRRMRAVEPAQGVVGDSRGGGAGSAAGASRTRVWLQVGAADSGGRRVLAVETPALVLATGAYDRVLPFPGWDLPGVYSAGAAQALAKGQRIAVGSRVLVAGTGPFLLPVAESLVGVGAKVVGLLEANKPSTVLRGWLTDPLAASAKLTEGLGYGALLARHRIPFRHGRTVIAAHGTDRVEAVTTARLSADWVPVPGTEERIEVDAVCLGFGFTPNLELAVSAGCQLVDGPAVLVDENQQTSTPGVWAAGELTGIGGAELSAAEGRVAGAAAAGAQGDRRAVAKGKRFARALDAAYPVRDGWLNWSGADTLVCRCEEVTRGELDEAVESRDVGAARSLKLSSRVGLGMCQGRVCGRNVSGISGVEMGHRRPIGAPVRLGDLADADVLEDL
jgi:D-hydroxyproline dehydrogenase subunit alpha